MNLFIVILVKLAGFLDMIVLEPDYMEESMKVHWHPCTRMLNGHDFRESGICVRDLRAWTEAMWKSYDLSHQEGHVATLVVHQSGYDVVGLILLVDGFWIYTQEMLIDLRGGDAPWESWKLKSCHSSPSSDNLDGCRGSRQSPKGVIHVDVTAIIVSRWANLCNFWASVALEKGSWLVGHGWHSPWNRYKLHYS